MKITRVVGRSKNKGQGSERNGKRVKLSVPSIRK